MVVQVEVGDEERWGRLPRKQNRIESPQILSLVFCPKPMRALSSVPKPR